MGISKIYEEFTLLRAEIVSVGTELLMGQIVDTNAAYMARGLAEVGVSIYRRTTVGDNRERLVTALKAAFAESDVVITIGGLGPTMDDITRDGLAEALDDTLVEDEKIAEGLRQFFTKRNMPVLESNLRQAMVPVHGRAIENPNGTAPGVLFEKDGKIGIALPGPPFELSSTAPVVLSRLAERSGSVVTTRTLHLSGIGESAVAERVEAAVEVPEGVALAYLAGGGIVRVRFTTSGPPEVLDPLVRAAEQSLGLAVWGHDDDTLDGVVHGLLAGRGQTVAVAESLTGGLLGAALSQRAGSSTTFRGSLVCYATDLKADLAGVPRDLLAAHGAVAATTAGALAQGARDRLGADWGLGVTGVAGPSEQEGKPVGTVHLAVAGPDGTVVRSLRLPGDRERIRLLAVTACLDLLRRALTGNADPTG